MAPSNHVDKIEYDHLLNSMDEDFDERKRALLEFD